jgi:polyhydroxybutyrate depolymerase
MNNYKYTLCLLLFFSCSEINTDTQHDTIVVDGRERQYFMYLPESYDGNKETPLIVVIHGYTNDISPNGDWYRIKSVADKEGFILCFPIGTLDANENYFWNAGGFFETLEGDINDVHFINRLLDDLFLKYTIDQSRVYAMGHSNGSMMTYRIAYELSERIAAAACVSGPMLIPYVSPPAQEVPLMHIHGYNDPGVPFEGAGRFSFPPVMNGLSLWISWNNCSTQPDSILKTQKVKGIWWKNENTNADVLLIRANGMEHNWPQTGNCNWEGSEYIWVFFKDKRRNTEMTGSNHLPAQKK